ncbi:MAG: polymerase protein [Candidatus Uhrbacteria bacterium GW2011_GWF2_41_16]|uniref:DNA polymerase I n=2 Tax=Candidatus Uhriibacteriota TaxID=1752732 RepID=A0A0G0VBS3_9BACT|nr:MAG: polymerase protein [Candidatus Uhrbacteria bacterium GW2011_GWA2_41_10]KKR87428.1 MAG: polymerase protein [Candidatus Uhrbacteria bacterium GW2011_GWC2_41_11]KKR98383.1 MAG: polymerase protein [Candidatus Uhrbacteria bacterium GW2011_GWF2_41_16]
MNMQKSLFLILDGNALLHRAWHALPPLTTRDGRVVHAAYGFAMMTEKLLEIFHPTHMAVAWDLPGKTFRHKKFAAYKATREKKAPELYEQIPLVQKMMDAYGIKSVSAEGYEADDLIGTLSQKANISVVIATGDLDALQLVNEKIQVLIFQKGISETKIYDEKSVKDRFHLTPSQMIDYKALRGDPSDNIPGVRGIGEKTAVELLQTHGTLDKIFEALHTNSIPEKIAKKLRGQEKTAEEAHELVTIVRDVPGNFDTSTYQRRDPNFSSLRELFHSLEFKTLLKKYEAPLKKTAKKSAVVRDVIHIREQIEMFRGAEMIAFAYQEKIPDLFGNVLESIALSNGTTHLVIPEPTQEHLNEIFDFLKTIHVVVAYDVKHFFHLRKEETELLCHWHDLLIASSLLEIGDREHTLESLADFYALEPIHVSTLKEHDSQVIGLAAATMMTLHKKTEKDLQDHGLWNMFEKIEMPLVPILFCMEKNGIRLDKPFLQTLSKEMRGNIDALTRRIYAESKEEFNINSPSQLAHILFETLHLPTRGIKKTKTGLSTAAPELEKLIDVHPIISLIVEYRELAKLKSTYVDVLPTLVQQDGRVHTTFHQTIASTGRLSSSDPNLQNIPTKTELGHRIRRAFIAEKGKQLLGADYSQLELRLISVLAKDEPFLAAFRAGEDIHARTAADLWNIPEGNVTPEQRRAAKTINFGVLYGMGPRALARATDFTQEEAQQFIDRFFEVHHAIRDFLDQTIIQAKKQGYVETMFKRRRSILDIHSHIPMLAAAAERMAINMPVQGTEADIIKMAMIQIDGWIRTLQAAQAGRSYIRLLLQVHDELVFEVDEAFVSETARAVKHFMETVVQLEIPLTVNIETGRNWGEMKPWEESLFV